MAKGRKPKLHIDPHGLRKAPPVPSHLSKDAKAEWRRVMPALVDRRILTVADLGCVESYCTSIGRVRETERQIQTGTAELAIYRIQNQAMVTARQLAAELGLTPVSRSKPTLRDSSEGDDGASPLDLP